MEDIMYFGTKFFFLLPESPAEILTIGISSEAAF